MIYPEDTRGKCISCGLLANYAISKETTLPNPRFYEIDTRDRQIGKVFRQVLGLEGVPFVDTVPVCFVDENDLPSEMDECRENALEKHHTVLSREQAAMHVFLKPRGDCCPRWYPHTPGYTPKEHVEMYNSERLFEITQKMQSDNLKVARLNFWATVLFGIIVVILSIMQLRLSGKPPQIVIQQPSQQEAAPVNSSQ